MNGSWSYNFDIYWFNLEVILQYTEVNLQMFKFQVQRIYGQEELLWCICVLSKTALWTVTMIAYFPQIW